ncbi:MAG TPA: signal recognition particle-docking protein FtsY [Candidatus Xenobia bacterium]|nr:signal recognition particle-docking protein FtsY [Candidatus Xenobia bacterium]
MPELETEKKSSWWSRLQQAVKRTHDQLSERLDDVLRGRKEIAPEVFAELEAVLLSADLGLETTTDLLNRLRERVERKDLADATALRGALREELTSLLRSLTLAPVLPAEGKPHVVFLVGVNGTGKTTTIAKLTRRWQQQGRRVVLAAADTFRAGAGEQLEIWAERLGAELIRHKAGADPAAVVYDAIHAAQSRGADVVFVDTAGRLHTKKNLMAELEKMKRAAAKLVPGAPHEILLVLDATTGQNGLAQAREFTGSVGVTGIVLTKLDGTAKGGIVVAITRTLGLPIRYLGVGEKADDLLDFDPDSFAASLFE